eukprot:CAMPEP_0178533868 /NCGR_PEP_ID=MMETSP0696-20121128/34715_1 /TAXON_ID=265572 /ORGANISM="Extubocellulus spinifer, Strain CCMP396" /LENGTH=40 /DNA_ID= /DNA_START= /DNA_END= /DNA_ORIENTATION=
MPLISPILSAYEDRTGDTTESSIRFFLVAGEDDVGAGAAS